MATLQTADTTQVDVNGSSAAITKPTNLADGDWVFLFTGDADRPTDAITSSGFTAIVDEGINSDFRITVLAKYVASAAGEPASYTVTFGGNTRSHIIASRISGAHATTLVQTLGARNSGSSAAPAATTITASATGKLCIRFAFAENQSGGNPSTDWSSHDADFTEVAEGGGTGGPSDRRMSVCLTYDASNASTTVNDTGSTIGTSGDWAAFIVEINDAAAGSGSLIVRRSLASMSGLITR